MEQNCWFIQRVHGNDDRKVQKKGRNITRNVTILESYDGAFHSNLDKARCNVVSFSSQVFSNETISNGVSTASSKNILTWQQFVGEETYFNLLPVINPVFRMKQEIQSSTIEQVNLKILELHDGDMLYFLIQHFLYSRKHNPFLLCWCDCGQGVRDKNHICKQVTNDEQKKYCKQSKTRWDGKISVDSSYNKSSHMGLVDENNWGVSYLGLSLEMLL